MTKRNDRDLFALGAAVLQRKNIGVLAYARTMELPDGDFAGTLYDPDLHPAQGCILRAIDAGAAWVAILKPVQDGGSLASFAPLLRRAHALAQNCIVAYPTMDSAKDAWSKKVWPMLERQGGMQPKKGGGSRGGAARVVTLPSGGSIILRAAGGRGESGQASVTADAMLVDEVDDWADMRVLRLIERRLSRSRDPLIIYVSTCKRDAPDGVERSRIVRLYEQGTQTRLHYPCPHCGEHQPLEWAAVDIERSTLVCQHCGIDISEAQRLAMLRQAKRVDGAKSHKFSIMWTALESPFPMMMDGQRVPVVQGLCAEYRAAEQSAANGDHGMMRQFCRDRLCRPYTGDMDDERPRHDEMGLAARAHAGLEFGAIPPEAAVVSIGCDVQKREAWWLGLAMAPDFRWWVVDFGYRSTGREHSEPTPQDQVAFLDAMRERTRSLGRCNVAGIDVGYNTDLVVGWAKRNGWLCVRGDQRASGHREAVPGSLSFVDIRRQNDRTLWHFIDGDPVKTELMKSLARPAGEAGAGHLPRLPAAKEYLIRHLTSERWDEKGRAWVKRPSVPNHLFDCLVYAWTLARLRVAAGQRPPRKAGRVGSFL
jgi:phage terminase large subunit GpA-like protein